MPAKLQDRPLSFHSIELLNYFSIKRHAMCLQTEAINAVSYNDLFSRGLLQFSKGDGLSLYIETTRVGKNLIALEELACEVA
jgi:hypothetical protein